MHLLVVIFLSFRDSTKMLFREHTANKKGTHLYMNCKRKKHKKIGANGGRFGDKNCSDLHDVNNAKCGRQSTVLQPTPEPAQRMMGTKARGMREESKRLKTNMTSVINVKWQALCEADWRVYPYLLLPKFQYQHHRKHSEVFPLPPSDSQTAGSV